jgi:2-polyprenyl-3-methyl-5-hydroxy-6-metoxy-1,4-benzoquinol methylase
VAEYDIGHTQPEWRLLTQSTIVRINRCRRHGSYFTENPPPPADIAKQYDYDAEAYFSRPNFDPSRKVGLQVQRLRSWANAGAKVLDLGGGNGAFAAAAAAAGFESYLQELATVDLETLGQSGVRWRSQGSNAGDHTFDVVTLWDVYEHIWPHGDLLAEIQQALKPAGKVIIEIPSPSNLVPVFLALARVAPTPRREVLLGQICNFTHLQLMTEAEIRATLPAQGLRVLHTERISALSYAGEEYAKRVLPDLIAKGVGAIFDLAATRRLLLGFNALFFET